MAVAQTPAWKVFQSPEIGWSIKYPNKWHSNVPSDKMALFSPEDISDPMALQAKGNVVVLHVQVYEVPEANTSLDDLCKNQSEMFQSMGMPPPNFTNATLGSLAAKKMVVTVPTPIMGPDGGVAGFTNSMLLQVLAIQEKRMVYTINCNCPSDDFDKYKTIISTMLSSFTAGERKITTLFMVPFNWAEKSICFRYPEHWQRQVGTSTALISNSEEVQDEAVPVTLEIRVDSSEGDAEDILSSSLAALTVEPRPEPVEIEIGTLIGHRATWKEGDKHHDRTIVKANAMLYTFECTNELPDNLATQYRRIISRILESVFIYKSKKASMPSLGASLSRSLSNKSGVLGALAMSSDDIPDEPPSTYTLHACENLSYKWGVLYDQNKFKFQGEIMGAYHFMCADTNPPPMFSITAKNVESETLEQLGQKLQKEALMLHPELKFLGVEPMTIGGNKAVMQTFSGKSQDPQNSVTIVVKQPIIIRDGVAVIFGLIIKKEKLREIEPLAAKIWNSIYHIHTSD